MSIGDCFDYCCGEHPPLTSQDFLVPAPGVVDAPLPSAQSAAGGSQDPTIAAAFEALDSLVSENADLRTRLAKAEQARDTSQAQLAHYRRTGW